MNLGGGLMSIAIGLNDAEQVVEALDRLMPRTALTLFAGAGERVSMYSAIGSTDVGGLSDLLIPILIAGLIVMNTMLGSVYERAREIGVFNAVGLAPSHVGALFLAEAFVYAVLGVVFGYLMGQGVSHLIVRFDWLPGFELNVSSLAAVGASLLVMAVVMLSTLYPARLASRMAMPAVEMGWRIPAAIDDRITLELPFTVTGQHSLGLNMYLKEFLDAHREVAVGDFACESVELLTLNSDGKTGYRLPFTAWLVPYDLGVSQQVELRTLPTEDLSIYTLTLSLQRLSGDTSSWLRLNRTFLNVIRKQFLIWRTLGRDGQERYIMRGMENLNAVSGTEPVFRQDTHV
jgi:hypothetical protein